MRNTVWIPALSLLVLNACAQRQARVWIEPPLGYDSSKTPRNLVYKIEEAESGKKESLLIPVSQVPKNLVVQGGPKSDAEATAAQATKADQWIKAGKLPAANQATEAKVSYLKGLEQVQALYTEKKFHQALISLAPLVEQYPGQAKLFTMQGTLYRRLGEKKLAYQSFKKSLELNATDAAVEAAAAGLAAEIGEE